MRVLLTIAVLLAFPAAARAGTVEVRSDTVEIGGRSGTETVYDVFFTAGPGEANDVRFAGAPRAVRIQDDGAPLTAGPSCAADGAGVTCVAPKDMLVFAKAGDGDDRMAAVGVTATLDGGAGDDVLSVSGATGYLTGGDGDDTLTGGEDDDVLSPGSGRDVVEGNGGIDYVHAVDAPGIDRIDGGAGDADMIDFSGSSLPGVRVELGRTPGITGFEDVRGSKGDDVLIGDAGENDLDGGGGNDRLEGRGGDDELEDNERGNDVLLGGPGADLLSGSGGDDRYDGGPGRDVYDLAPYRRGGHIDLRCSGAADQIQFSGSGLSVRLHSRCRRVFLDNVELTFSRRGVAVRTGPGLAPPPCRVRLSTATQAVTLPHLVRAHSRRAHLKTPATLTVRFAHACGGRYYTAARLRIG
jgi:Ca2+-binding RTX toxin-like protein